MYDHRGKTREERMQYWQSLGFDYSDASLMADTDEDLEEMDREYLRNNGGMWND